MVCAQVVHRCGRPPIIFPNLFIIRRQSILLPLSNSFCKSLREMGRRPQQFKISWTRRIRRYANRYLSPPKSGLFPPWQESEALKLMKGNFMEKIKTIAPRVLLVLTALLWALNSAGEAATTRLTGSAKETSKASQAQVIAQLQPPASISLVPHSSSYGF